MTRLFQVKPGDLAKVWSVPKSDNVKQFTIRIPLESFQKVQAMEMMFPGRSRNELISDLLSTAIEEFQRSLDREWKDTDDPNDPAFEPELHESEYRETELCFDPASGRWGVWTGPGAEFDQLVERVKQGIDEKAEEVS